MSDVFDNVVKSGDLKTQLTQAFLDLDNILVNHCGPFASSCVIGSRWRQTNDVDEFTKDGIKILTHLIVSNEPSARFAARMARFIGLAVDKRCHDGTTTSMLLFCRLAIAALEKLNTSLMSKEQYNWAWEFYQALSMCQARLISLKITDEDILQRCLSMNIDTNIETVRAAMAYHMAMISSKGDHDLSSKVSEVIRSAPKKIYGMFRDIPLAVETEEPYILKKQDHDLLIKANLGNIQDYNYRSDTQYLSEDAVLFVTGNDIVSNSYESIFLQAFISKDPRQRPNLSDFGDVKGWEEFHEGKKNLIILTTLMQDANLIMAINEFNKANPSIKISWFTIQVHGRMRTSFNKTIHYMAGRPLFGDVMEVNPVLSLIGLEGPKVSAHLIGSTLKISNLYEKDGEVFHLYYREPELFEPYTRFVKETEELIEFANSNITNPALDQDELTFLISLYRALTCQNIVDIEVGGSAHDQYANRTVYEDAIGSALSAINEGIIMGGYGHLAKACQLWSHTTNNPLMPLFGKALTDVVADSLRANDIGSHVSVADLLRKLPDDVTDSDGGKWSYIVADTESAAKGDHYIHMRSLDKDMMEDFLAMSPGKTVLLQAFAGYHEQFKRFRDILPKLANTRNLADMRVKEGESYN